MDILYINHYAGSKELGMEYRPYYLGKEWVRLGHRVTVVGGSFSHVRTVQPKISGVVTEETIDGIRYVWLKTPRYSGNGVRRVWSMFVFIFRVWWHRRRILGELKPSAVVASSTYTLDILPAYRIAKRYKANLIYDVPDLWPLTPIEIGGMSPRHPFIVLVQIAENFAYRKSDFVVSVLKNAYEHMGKHGLAKEKFVYIPNGFDLSDWEGQRASMPREHAECLQSLRNNGRFIVGYVGGHQPSNAMSYLLDAAELMRGSPVAFVLIGQGSEKEQLQKKASERKIDNVVFLPPIAKACVPAALAAMDALYIGWKRHPLYRFGISPNKLMDYLMSAKPVIHAVEAGNDPVAESGCGISCPPENPRDVANAVEKMMHFSNAERVAMGQRGREFVLENYQYSKLALQFLDAMKTG
jgi:glycosyltransferase involved in cell wall biosynthesis